MVHRVARATPLPHTRGVLTMIRKSLACSALLALTLLPVAAFAQKKVPGEMYRNTTSMEMMGMSMPGRTADMCVPVGKAEALGRPDDPSCRVYDTHNEGNRFTAKMSCTGKEPMEGDMEIVTEGKTVRGLTHMKMKEGSGTMKFESTRLGTPCAALDYSDYKPPVVKGPTYDPETICKEQLAGVAKDPATAGNAVDIWRGKDSACGKSPTLKSYCSIALSHRGFMGMDMQEKRMAQLMPGQKLEGTSAPLTTVMGICGVGKMPAAAEATRTRLLSTAEAEGEYLFLVGEGGDAGFATAVAAAKRECSGRGGTNAKNAKFARFCDPYGPLLVRGDRAGVMSMLDGSCSGDCGSSGSSSASGGGSSSGGRTGSASGSTGSSGQGTQQQGGQQDAAKDSAKDKAKEAVDKGKKLLRGILGGG